MDEREPSQTIAMDGVVLWGTPKDDDAHVRGGRGWPRLTAFARAHWRHRWPGLLFALLLAPGTVRGADAEADRLDPLARGMRVQLSF